ncbi:hypothetical protein DE146DRAFT_665666 [Phaeosphaeria sp. MPI-PUGE-AT-0046c]|nr:hypothetical protein DE146DRAFT_665666 [Phaeosphaeria sp. MPI-PUGE-AT-0046c]
MPVESDYAFVLSSPTQESLPPYSPGWRQEGDFGEKAEEGGGKSRSKWREWATAYGEAPRVFNAAFDSLWRSRRKKLLVREQIIAFLLVVIFGVVPLALLGHFTSRGQYGYTPPAGENPFYGIFQDKILACGDSFGTPENATVTGVEKIFVLDQTYGQFTFAQVKTIDVVWDIAVGRGVQMIAWAVGYTVFSDALLRAIERHPASFRIFQRIALEGPSILSLVTLLKELWRAKSKRTRALFLYIWLATLYILSIPMFLSAMTGYDSTSIPWVSLDDENNIVPASTLETAWISSGTWDQPFNSGPICLNPNDYYRTNQELWLRKRHCDCQLNDGTIVNATSYGATLYGVDYSNFVKHCRFDYPGNNKTFVDNIYNDFRDSPQERKCNSTFDIVVNVNGTKQDAININGTMGYCYNTKGYAYQYLQDRSRCLPDTANPTYQWGFSTMLSGLFVFFHVGWVLSMYILWQDAQFNSKLVGTGYQMTPLRAAFAMAKAAKRRTGLGEKQLVRANTKELEQELYGSRKKKATEVEYGIFDEVDEEQGEVEVRRRIVRPKDEDEERDERKSVEVAVRKSGEMHDVPLNP